MCPHRFRLLTRAALALLCNSVSSLAGKSVPAVELTAASVGLTTATLHPPVEDTEPGKLSSIAYV